LTDTRHGVIRLTSNPSILEGSAMTNAPRTLLLLSLATGFGGLVASAAAQTADAPSIETQPGSHDGADGALAERVKAALAGDQKLLSRHIEVSAKHGVVHLGGFVESDGDLKRALQDAKSVSGVSSVDNEMELKGPPKTGPH
jgi:hyperosmotically inducible protein